MIKATPKTSNFSGPTIFVSADLTKAQMVETPTTLPEGYIFGVPAVTCYVEHEKGAVMLSVPESQE